MNISIDSNSEPTMDLVVKRRRLLSQSRHSLIWSAINAISALIIVFDINQSFMSCLIDSNILKTFVYIFEVIICLTLIVNALYDLCLWFWRKHLMIDLELTSNQMKAFGIKDNELGFKLWTQLSDSNTQTLIPSVNPVFEMSLMSDLDRHSSLNSTQLSNLNTSSLSDCSLDTTSTSWHFERHTQNNSPVKSPDVRDGSKLVRLRRSANKLVTNESIVRNEHQLQDYLKDFERKEQLLEEITDSEKRRQTNTLNTGWSPLLNQSMSPLVDDINQITYQCAIDSPLRLNNVEFDSVTTSATTSKAMDSLLLKLKINETILNQWIENIRKWISLTILSRVVQQMDKINDEMVRSGHFDAFIGETSLQNIKQLVDIKKPEFSSLASVLPFLELTSNQQYLVQRIRDLSKGGCVGQFKWNSGGTYNLKTWTEDLVTDSEILMHFFCTYMDLRLPSNPSSPEGKAFTNLYYKSAKGVIPKSVVYILEFKSNPPHYKVWTEEDGVWDLPIGRNNLFHAIIVFLHCIQDKQFGLLGRINLGSSGLNILWVIQR